MTESTIDMDRAMQGIDCEVITWTNCAERMPQENQKTIFRRSDKHNFMFTKNVVDKHSLLFYVKMIDDLEWTPYTPEAWKLLNPKID